MDGVSYGASGPRWAAGAVADRPDDVWNAAVHCDLLVRVVELLTSSALLPTTQLSSMVCNQLAVKLGAERVFVFGLERGGTLSNERVVVAAAARSGKERLVPTPKEVHAAELAFSTAATVRLPGSGQGGLMAVPMCTSSRVMGVLLVSDGGQHRAGNAAAVIDAISGLLAQAIDRELVATDRRMDDEAAAVVRRLLAEGSQATTVEQAATLLARVAAEAFHAERAGMYVVDRDGTISFAVGIGVLPELSDALVAALVGKQAKDSPAWHHQGLALYPDSTTVSMRPGGLVETLGVTCHVSIPLLSAEGQIGFVICGDTNGRREWTAREEVLARQLALEGALIIDTARLREAERMQLAEMERQAFHDQLTGLPNRALLAERLDKALAEPEAGAAGVALLLLDLNDFKQVNDTLGHHYGDILLRDVAAALSGVTRAGDTVARLGGDEFAILVRDDSTSVAATAMAVAARVQQRLREPFCLAEMSLQVVASIGVAVFPDHGRDPSSLLKHADAAMYEAKRNQEVAVLYDQARDLVTVDRLTLFTDLRHAIDAGQLVLHYQPKFDLRSGEVVGAEALVRWDHPRRGLLLPGEFLPVAEATGLIDAITLWVLDRAVKDQSGWHQAGLDLDLAVNVAPGNLRDPRFSETVGRVTGAMPAGRLIIELTETGVMRDPEHSLQLLARLREMGVRVSVDDFGVGCSSLSLLGEAPGRRAEDRRCPRRRRERPSWHLDREDRPRARSPAWRLGHGRGRRERADAGSAPAPRLRPGAGLLPLPACPGARLPSPGHRARRRRPLERRGWRVTGLGGGGRRRASVPRLEGAGIGLVAGPAGDVAHHLEVTARSGLRRRFGAVRARLQDEGGFGTDVGHDEGGGVLVVVQRSGLVSAKAERPEPDRSHPQGIAEHGPHAGLDSRRGEGRPSVGARPDQVRFGHRPVLAVGVNRRPLTEAVLKLLDEVAHLVGRAQRTLGTVVPHQHYPDPARGGDLGADLAQPFGPEGVARAGDQQAYQPCPPPAPHISARLGPTRHLRHETGSLPQVLPTSRYQGPEHAPAGLRRPGTSGCTVPAQHYTSGSDGHSPAL